MATLRFSYCGFCRRLSWIKGNVCEECGSVLCPECGSPLLPPEASLCSKCSAALNHRDTMWGDPALAREESL